VEKTILVVSDKLLIYERIWLNAANAGYRPTIVDNFEDAGRLLLRVRPSVLVLDSTISEISAEDFLADLRASPNTRYLPVIVVASVDYADEHLKILEAGADDVVDLQFSSTELFARINAVLRPKSLKHATPIIALGVITLIPESRRVLIHDKAGDIEIRMRPKTFEVFHLLSTRAGLVLSREEILTFVWGLAAPVGLRNVDVHITALRSALRGSRSGLHIDAIPGKGYRLAITSQA
jgi:DNA-binding response OmpR family regulator